MRFAVLGPVRANLETEAVPLGPPKRRLLLAVLLCSAGRPVGVDTLVEALWGDNAPASAVDNIYVHISQLRRVLGAQAITGRGREGYALAVEPSAIDAHRFAGLAQAGSRALAAGEYGTASRKLREALSLWRGPAYGELADEPCLRHEVTRLEELRLTALADRIEADLALGLHDEVAAELLTLTRAHPYRERYAGQLMLALYRSGRQADALDVYTRTRKLLDDELGLDPGPELTQVHERILRRDPVLDAQAALPASTRTGPAQLPRTIADFTGRKAELARILSHIDEARTSDGVVVITAIDGMAGIGKTALAVRAAHRLAEWYPDGTLFIDLHAHTAGHRPTDPAAALARLLHAIGVDGDLIPQNLEERAALWRSELSHRRVLVVLDNAASAEQLGPLLPGSARSLVLVTSRRRLLELDSAHALTLDVLPAAEAAALFTAIVGARALAEPEAVAEAVELCGRLPLAIRLAAARLGNRPRWSVEGLVGRLRDERRRLAELSAQDRSVGAAFTLSYDQLDNGQRRMFRLLGLHPGVDVDVYAAAALAGVTVERADALLEALLDAQMLQQPAANRYSLHDLLRQYAADRAMTEEPEAERGSAVRRALDFYSLAARRAADLLQPGRMALDLRLEHVPADAPTPADAKEAMRWLNQERQTLTAAVHRATALGLDWPAWHITRELGVYCMKAGHVSEILGIEEAAVDIARRLPDRRLLALSLLNLSSSHSHSGHVAHAIELTEQAWAIARDLEELGLERSSRRFLASLYVRAGRFTEAAEGFLHVIDMAREAGDQYTETICLAYYGDLLTLMGHNREALAPLEQAIRLATDLDLADTLASAATSAAWAAGGLDDYDQAFAHVDSGLTAARRAGLVPREVRLHSAHADVLHRAGRHDEALSTARQGFAIVRDLDSPVDECDIRICLGALLLHAHEPAEARHHYEEALGLAERMGDLYDQIRALDGLAHVCHALAEEDRAEAYWARAHPLAKGMPLSLADLIQARIPISSGRPRSARRAGWFADRRPGGHR
ncbi:BTAD domain-containing putative transcriptional regulator [Nonomuraea sp. NPDC050556]|uniref:AfsR/SARP family transcriptional regulator n=1 Tax=Nonomuraea sp. NPDC050556 TaxID=3364369 RepID=UPI0037B1DA8E